MTEQALPCVVCGTVLYNVWDEAENQPSDGVAFSSPGHYGSTIWDPMDGCIIELNICDPCLVEAGQKGRVLSGRPRRQVTLAGIVIGYEELDTPLVEWHKDLPVYGDQLDLNLDELDTLPKTVHIDQFSLDYAKHVWETEDW